MNISIIKDLALRRKTIAKLTAALDENFKTHVTSCGYIVHVGTEGDEHSSYYICSHEDYPTHRTDICQLKYCPIANEGVS